MGNETRRPLQYNTAHGELTALRHERTHEPAVSQINVRPRVAILQGRWTKWARNRTERETEENTAPLGQHWGSDQTEEAQERIERFQGASRCWPGLALIWERDQLGFQLYDEHWTQLGDSASTVQPARSKNVPWAGGEIQIRCTSERKEREIPKGQLRSHP